MITDTGLCRPREPVLTCRSLRGAGAPRSPTRDSPTPPGLENLDELTLGINRLDRRRAGPPEGAEIARMSPASPAPRTSPTRGSVQLEADEKPPNPWVIRYTMVTDSGVERLRRARPGLDIEYKPGPGYLPTHPSSRGDRASVPPPGPVPFGVPPPRPRMTTPQQGPPEAPLQPPETEKTLIPGLTPADKEGGRDALRAGLAISMHILRLRMTDS